VHNLLHVKPTTGATYSNQHTKCLINVKVTGWGTLITEHALYSSKHRVVIAGGNYRCSTLTHSTLPSCTKSALYQKKRNLELKDRVTGLLI